MCSTAGDERYTRGYAIQISHINIYIASTILYSTQTSELSTSYSPESTPADMKHK